ncbi:MAG: glycosyltransferase [Planctomycetota bacterium]
MTRLATRVSYVTCTRNRRDELTRTLRTLDELHRDDPSVAEVVLADNASDPPIHEWLPQTELHVEVVTLPENIAAAARNAAAERARSAWLVMLDDDSAPLDLGFLDVLDRVDDGVAAVLADVTLPDGSRERGGLPEVLVGCGAAVRREAYLGVGGYDPAIFFAAEEPDLCARLIAAGWRLEASTVFRVLHHKTPTNRDLDRMLRLLTRNAGVLIERTTPDAERRSLRRDHIRRCAWIARKEDAVDGFAQGLAELRSARRSLVREPLSRAHFERFTGLHHAREAIAAALQERPFATAALVEAGKHAWAVERALRDAGVEIVGDADRADRLAIATMSPGPMLDAVDTFLRSDDDRVLAPWTFAQRYAASRQRAPSLA